MAMAMPPTMPPRNPTLIRSLRILLTSSSVIAPRDYSPYEPERLSLAGEFQNCRIGDHVGWAAYDMQPSLRSRGSARGSAAPTLGWSGHHRRARRPGDV